jgi:peroxiredoxin Q/BCP
VSFDDPAANAAFANKFNFPFKLLADADRKMAVAYGAADAGARYPNRISYLIDGEGKIAAAYPKVNPADHASEVLADAARL